MKTYHSFLCVFPLVFCLLCPTLYAAASAQAAAAEKALPEAHVFAPGVISGPASDGSPAFSPDGNTLFFTQSTAHWTAILQSHKVKGEWTKPVLAPFSGEWPDSSPAMSPDGTYIVFQSTRPLLPLTKKPKPGERVTGVVSNLWRVDRVGATWSAPTRLPDTVNIGPSIWKPSVAADGTVYLTVIDATGAKRLYSSAFSKGVYETAKPLPFSDGTMLDVDPEISPDGSLLLFCSAGRVAGDTKDRLFLVHREGAGWGAVTQIRYADDEKPYGASTDDEPKLGPDHRTLYFSSDRVVPVHFPRSRERAKQDLERLDAWDNSNSNVWSISLERWL